MDFFNIIVSEFLFIMKKLVIVVLEFIMKYFSWLLGVYIILNLLLLCNCVVKDLYYYYLLIFDIKYEVYLF